MFVEQLESLTSDQIFNNFDQLTRLRYNPYEESVKKYSTARRLHKFFEK